MRRRSEVPTTEDRDRAHAIGWALEAWYAGNGRDFPWRHWRDPYRVAITEVLLQRTRAQHVSAFVSGFFATYPDWRSLSEANPRDLEEALSSLGLQRRRAASLAALARAVVAKPDADWEALPGIGQYVARAIAVSLFDKPVAMVDANFIRVVKRAFDGPWMADYRYDRRLQDLAASVVMGARRARHVNWSMLDLGAAVCVAGRPRCSLCPIRSLCLTGKSDQEVIVGSP